MLIVEDDTVLRKHLARLFAAEGYVVSTAGSCAEALALFATMSVDNLLLDATLPDGDGLSLLATLSERQSPRRTILMTAYCTAEAERRAESLRVSHILRKPLDLAELIGAFPEE